MARSTRCRRCTRKLGKGEGAEYSARTGTLCTVCKVAQNLTRGGIPVCDVCDIAGFIRQLRPMKFWDGDNPETIYMCYSCAGYQDEHVFLEER